MRAGSIALGATLALTIAIARADEAKSPGAQPASQPLAGSATARKIDFNRDVRPILSDNCYFCHGPDKNHRKADLRLDTKDGLFALKEDVAAVVPGKLDDSVMWLRITSDDPEFRMPHQSSNKKLTSDQIATIKLWIEQGRVVAGSLVVHPADAAGGAEVDRGRAAGVCQKSH
jgi:hypothetical protein